MTTSDEEEWFRSIQYHLVSCDRLPAECPTCRAVWGEVRPRALIAARFREGRPRVQGEEGAKREGV